MWDTVFGNPWVRAVGALLALALVVFLCIILRPVLVPLFLAFLVAYALDPLVDFFERRKISRTVTIGCLAVFGVALAASIPLFLVPSAIEQADRLITSAQQPGAGEASAWKERFAGWADQLPLEEIARGVGWVEEDAQVEDIRAVYAERIGGYIKEHARELLKSFFAAGQTAAQVVSSIGRGAYGFALFVGNLVLFAFVAGYLLKDFDRLVESVRELVPPRFRPYVFDLCAKIHAQVQGFIQGQIVVCVCLGVMYTIGLVLCDVPFAVIIGVFAGIVSFIPYLGIALGIGPAVLLALLQHGISWHVAGTVATFVVAQSIEGSFLTPKIVGDKVGLNPVWVILAVIVFGSYLGFLGLLLAVPIAATLKVLVVAGVDQYRQSTLFEAPEPPAKKKSAAKRKRGPRTKKSASS